MAHKSELLFVDPLVPDLNTLLENLRPEVRAIVLDGARPAARQMAEALVGIEGSMRFTLSRMARLGVFASHPASGQLIPCQFTPRTWPELVALLLKKEMYGSGVAMSLEALSARVSLGRLSMSSALALRRHVGRSATCAAEGRGAWKGQIATGSTCRLRRRCSQPMRDFWPLSMTTLRSAAP